MRPNDLHAGTPVRVRVTKWDDSPHWAFDGIWLGADRHGDWLGFPPGTSYARPGKSFVADWPAVGMFPRAGWAPAFNDGHPRGLGIYVDLASVPEWRFDGHGTWTISYVDLDLDVVERDGAPAYIDDEDEFAEHAITFGYPADVVARVRADADAVLEAVRRHEPPFDGATAARWLARMRGLAATRLPE
ncbi:DUF402 domain-containing protein [Agromyces intestinalis]|uniref:DUF402 domain-containing protein n=1 Tax=Agromyces intestinalis TaxID=2592652 RepID=A0A5C1YDH0_9MICO|nr:DUF402 domain-containing protein [Agromyces intestinalis]QEO14153.1 DUF402 domain-containing protein [Agromyces intestinalis]